MPACTVSHPGWSCAKTDGHLGPCAPAPASSLLDELTELRDLARLTRTLVDDVLVRGKFDERTFVEVAEQLADCEEMMPAIDYRRRRTG